MFKTFTRTHPISLIHRLLFFLLRVGSNSSFGSSLSPFAFTPPPPPPPPRGRQPLICLSNPRVFLLLLLLWCRLLELSSSTCCGFVSSRSFGSTIYIIKLLSRGRSSLVYIHMCVCVCDGWKEWETGTLNKYLGDFLTWRSWSSNQFRSPWSLTPSEPWTHTSGLRVLSTYVCTYIPTKEESKPSTEWLLQSSHRPRDHPVPMIRHTTFLGLEVFTPHNQSGQPASEEVEDPPPSLSLIIDSVPSGHGACGHRSMVDLPQRSSRECWTRVKGPPMGGRAGEFHFNYIYIFIYILLFLLLLWAGNKFLLDSFLFF